MTELDVLRERVQRCQKAVDELKFATNDLCAAVK